MSDKSLSFDAVVFDLDGVITKTAVVHAQAWKRLFDDFLREREKEFHEPFRKFTYEKDYLTYVDGKPRYEGVASFLKSRSIKIPYGDKNDSPEKNTVCGLGNRKNQTFLAILKEKGVETFPSTIELIHDLKSNHIHIGVASSSKNCKSILQKVGIEDLFETRVDGVVSEELGLNGKPQGDIFVMAAQNMGCEPARAVVVEDAVAGVQAGRNGQFGLVIGVARENNEADLKENGADFVVTDFKGIKTKDIEEWFGKKIR